MRFRRLLVGLKVVRPGIFSENLTKIITTFRTKYLINSRLETGNKTELASMTPILIFMSDFCDFV